MEKKCNKCQLCDSKEMAQIPYIEHEKRMFKAYQREKCLKAWLFGTNLLWLLITAILLFVR